ncbi:MAG: tol-pal system protein YbgF [Alsobacter sp.]
MLLRLARAAAASTFGLAALGLLLAAPLRPAAAQDAAELLVRVNRLENQVRALSGQIEQLQFQNKKLEDQLTRFQQDVEFRFQEMKGGARPSAGAAPAPTPAPTAGKPQKRSDAFDPGADPAAPGAPRALGSLPGEPQPGASQSGAPQVVARGGAAGDIGTLLEDEADGPIDLEAMGKAPKEVPAGALPAPGLPARTTAALPPPAPGSVQGLNPRPVSPAAAQPSIAAAGTGSARDTYDLAYGLVLQRQYDQAEMAFRQFLQTHPRDKLAPDATYWLGETYYRRGRYPDAVEQYLKIYKTFGSSRIAPDSMLKLSLSLRGMNQPEQACATLAEIGRKYPEASSEVKAGVQREQKRGNC